MIGTYKPSTHIYCLFVLFLASPSLVLCSALILGSIQFPFSLTKVPNIRVYYGGVKIKTESDTDTRRLTFALPRGSNQNKFFVLITDAVGFSLAREQDNSVTNTIEYLKVLRGHQYRLFELSLVQPSDSVAKSTEDNQIASAEHVPATTPMWHIQEQKILHEDQRVPDTTVIICYNPEFIDTMRAGTIHELPVLIVKPNIIDLAGGTESLVHQTSDEMLIASMDIDTIHRAINESVKQIDKYRAIIAAPIT